MATVRWIGNAPAVKQVTTLTPAAPAVNDVFIVTINGKQVTFTAATTVVADITAGLQAALAACTYPEFREITWTDDSTQITATGNTAGKPFTAIPTVTGSGTLTAATPKPCSGPNFWNVGANWDTGAVPVLGDDIYIENSNVSILYGIDGASTGVYSTFLMATLNIAASFTGQIGLADANGSGSSAYNEYRQRSLQLSAMLVNVGYGPGAGSSLIRLDTGLAQTNVVVSNTGTPTSANVPALSWRGAHPANTLEVLKGSVGVAIAPGETAEATASIGFVTNATSDAQVRFGPSVTFHGTLAKSGGDVEIRSNVAQVDQTDGTLTVAGSAAVTTLNLFGGAAYYNSTSALTTCNIGGRGKLDFSRDMATKTVTNPVALAAGGQIYDPFGVARPAFVTDKCTLADVKVVTGYSRTYTVT